MELTDLIPVVTIATMEPLTASLVIAGAGALGLGGLILQAPRLRGTTMLAPWCWLAGSLVAITTVEALTALNGDLSPSWLASIRYAAATTSFCPLMATLGAKKPQNKAWQFVVLALWITLCAPAVEWLLRAGGTPQPMHSARAFFLAALILLGAMNYLPTRYWLSCLLYLAGQVALLTPFFPGWIPNFARALADPRFGVLAIVAAILVAPRRPASSAGNLAPLDRVWIDFRNLYGSMWGLRIAERVNATGRLLSWPVILNWQGFTGPDGESPPVLEPRAAAELDECLRGLLRRFVTPEWINSRLQGRGLDRPD